MSEPVAKEQALCDTLASLDSVIVAYSGGVDSAYLAYIASRTLGDRSVAVTADHRANPANRCYYCKHELYTNLSRLATARGAVVVDGNNADDRGDYRPGRQAAREFGVRSPLDDVNLTKSEIRELSHRAGLP